MTNLAELEPDNLAAYATPPSYDDAQFDRQTPLHEILHRASEDSLRKPSLRSALSEIRDDLERRTRQWRNSAKVVEQTLQHLSIAEAKRSDAFEALMRIETEVVRTGQHLAQAMASFDETGESKNIDPRFAQSEAALLSLDKATSKLLAAQNCCRAAWIAYSEALAVEEQLRRDVQIATLSD